MIKSLRVSPAILWVENVSFTLSNEMEISGWWSSLTAVAATLFTKDMARKKSANLYSRVNATAQFPVRHLAGQFPGLAVSERLFPGQDGPAVFVGKAHVHLPVFMNIPPPSSS